MPSASKIRRTQSRAEKFTPHKTDFSAAPGARHGHAEGSSRTGTAESRPQESDSDSEDSDARPAAHSHGSLLQSLATGRHHGHKRKKRKLSNSVARDTLIESETRAVPTNGERDNNGIEDGMKAVEAVDNGLSTDDNVVDPFAGADEEVVDDPFEIHFANPDEDDLARKLEAVKQRKWSHDRIQREFANGKEQASLLRARPTSVADVSSLTHGTVRSISDLKIKKRLLDPASTHMPSLDEIQSNLVPTVFGYQDLLFTARTPTNARSLRDMTCLHLLNHIFKTRDRIIKNTSKVSREGQQAESEFRDQGFTRPKVLILLETRQAVVRYLDAITSLCSPEQQENRQRFRDAFDGGEATLPDTKPNDFRELFEGNEDNDFRLGVKFTRKTIKYYSQFYTSDIIIASPLGLRRAMKIDDAKRSDYDFLSSIEMLVLDQTEAMLMQNWEHVEYVFDYLNLQPKEPHGCDFSRVRRWYLDGNAKYLRQTIVFSAYETPELAKMYSQDMLNVEGKVKSRVIHNGVLSDVGIPVSQAFHRFQSHDIISDPDARFNAFTSVILPSITRLTSTMAEGQSLGVLLFIPSYFDFTRVRNFFQSSPLVQDLPWGGVSENDSLPLVKRARSHFVSGRYSVLLYTGRAHHFRRYRIRGVKHVMFYGVPDNPHFYSELVGGFLGVTEQEGATAPRDMSVKCLFSKWDRLALERIVGSQRIRKMLGDQSMGDTFEFK
ncbi:MAG: rRNA-binding ribosome biosynthesis protein utp25 [Chrysothrix sp. TS-e1954]|nr:MAG: rRNA-binding ribosome biosynthesis protein utp25 [Chrysothrix sp. TS-e1954]